MKRTVLHTIVTLLLLINLAPLVIIAWLQVQEFRLRQSVEERMRTGKQVTVAVPEATVVWKEYGRECFINGQLFDVTQLHLLDGTYQLTGVFDAEETETGETLSHSTHSTNRTTLLNAVFLLLCTTAAIVFVYCAPRGYTCLKRVFLFCCRYPNPAHPVLVPPPRPLLVSSHLIYFSI